MQQTRRAGLLEAPLLRTAGKNQQVWLEDLFCIFWNSCGVHHGRFLETCLMVTHQVSYHKLTQVDSQMLFSLRKTPKNCGHQRLQDIARKHTINQRKTALLHVIVTLIVAHCSVSTKLQTMHTDFVLDNASQHKKIFTDVEEVKTCLNHYFVYKTVIFYY